MNITTSKVKKILIERHGWNFDVYGKTLELLIKDTIKVIDDQLIYHKNISIKNSKHGNWTKEDYEKANGDRNIF